MNLKQAARRLGVHYQTVYRYVVSGRLAAVRIGPTYDVSEQAIEQFLARTRANFRSQPDAVAEPMTVDGAKSLVVAAREAYSAVALSPTGVFDVVAEGLSRSLGGLVALRLLDDDGMLVTRSVHHTDARRRSIAWTQIDAHLSCADEYHERVAISAAKPVLIRHVPQDQLRAHTSPELVQFLDDAGAYSMLCVPIAHGDAVYGVVTLRRDFPSRPYTTDDVAVVSRVAAIAGAAVVRAQAAQQGWRRRRALMASIGELSADDVLGAASTLVEAEGTAVLVCDAQGRVIAANRAAGELGGVDPEELIGLPIEELPVVEEQAVERELLDRLLVGELSYSDAPRRVLTDTGERKELAVHRGVVRNQAAEPVALVVIAEPVPSPDAAVMALSAAS